MQKEVDIIEDKILIKYPKILEILLCDRTTKKNIFWGTENYGYLGNSYNFSSIISIDLITGLNGNVIMPRVLKDKVLQQTRVKDMAEVFTPSWICNEQNNGIDYTWFESKNVFNKSDLNNEKGFKWILNKEKIKFPKNKSWQDYVSRIVLEITCGEAPYLTSRYDTTTGVFIPIKNRIGLLDRKLRIINENVSVEKKWLIAAEIAFKSTYGFEWQGDSLLLARESLIYTFVEYYYEKFKSQPALSEIEKIAYIISWNIWQMDGLKGVIPNSCGSYLQENKNLFGDVEKTLISCKGCESKNIHKHNGLYAKIMDWEEKNPLTGKDGVEIRFIDLMVN